MPCFVEPGAITGTHENLEQIEMKQLGKILVLTLLIAFTLAIFTSCQTQSKAPVPNSIIKDSFDNGKVRYKHFFVDSGVISAVIGLVTLFKWLF
jgi:hypothetical protein